MLPLYSTGGLPRGSGSAAQADSIRLRLGIPIADVFIFKWTRKSKSPPWPQRTRQEWGTRFTGDWLLSAARSLWDRQESQSQSQRRRTGVSALHVQRKRKRPSRFLSTAFILCRQRPTLPHTFACSTIGPAGLNFRVRDGNGWNPRGKITDKSEQLAISS